MKLKTRRTFVTIVTLLTLMVGSVNILSFATKTLSISIELFQLSDSVQFYNDSPRKTDSWTIDVIDIIEYRNEKFYQSEDWWTRTFSNMFVLWKMIIVVVMIAAYPVIVFMWLHVLAVFIERRRRRLQKNCRRRTR